MDVNTVNKNYPLSVILFVLIESVTMWDTPVNLSLRLLLLNPFPNESLLKIL